MLNLILALKENNSGQKKKKKKTYFDMSASACDSNPFCTSAMVPSPSTESFFARVRACAGRDAYFMEGGVDGGVCSDRLLSEICDEKDGEKSDTNQERA